MGLLSSLSLSSRVHKIHIYGPPGIFQYLQYSRKYSQTTFKYSLEIHTIRYNYINNHLCNIIYALTSDSYNSQIQYSIIEKEKIGRFRSKKAHLFNIESGPVYGYLKSQGRFITPDGNILSGKYFTHDYSIGVKFYIYHRKISFKIL